MLASLITDLKELYAKVDSTWRLLDLDKLHGEIEATEWETQQPDFWKDQEKAQKTSRHLSDIKDTYESWRTLRDDAKSLLEYAQLADAENDNAVEDQVVADFEKLKVRLAKQEFDLLLGDKYDGGDAIVAFHAGAGGTEAQDWADMLLRMYLRYAEKKGWRVKFLDRHDGSEAGIKSATLSVEGHYAYGYMKCEAGVHRLVRQSPFNADHLRQTSFALIEVLPELGDIEEVKIEAKDIRIDTYLSGGHGGQGVQTTYSAVRITHLPTNIVVTCQNERNQTQNKDTAMRILRAKLHAIYLKQREDEKKELRGEFTSAEWGSQIRSYVLHPYKMVKDHRTKYEVQDAEGVLEGDLDGFVESYLRFLKSGGVIEKDVEEEV